jgi:hypothetical protein
MKSWTIYVIGVVALGLAYQFLKQAFPGWIFLLGVIGYLLLLNWVARRYGR